MLIQILERKNLTQSPNYTSNTREKGIRVSSVAAAAAAKETLVVVVVVMVVADVLLLLLRVENEICSIFMYEIVISNIILIGLHDE